MDNVNFRNFIWGALCYKLEGPRFESRMRWIFSIKRTTEKSEFESRWGQEFSLLQIVQTGSEVHPTSSPMGTGGSFPGGKTAGA
jgi:hypothetical protein